jgi:signal transduction histidine kinase
LDWVVTVGSATAAAELLAALLFACIYLRRTVERPYAIAALLSLAAALRSISLVAVAARWASAGAALAAQSVADGILPVALVLTVHFAIVYGGRRAALWLRGSLYAAALGLLLIQWGAHAATSRGSANALALSETAGGVCAAAAVLALAGRAYLNGVHGALPLVVGGTVLFATAANDAGVAAGFLATGHLIDAGLLVFVVAMATAPSAGYAWVSGELEKRTEELRTRTRELRRSYEELRTAQEELLKKEQLAVVGELAAVIAHEVRNPLAVIANAGAGLRKAAISREDHDVLLAILDEETSRLNRLVSDLLRYARPVNVQRTRLALRDLLERAMAVASAGAKGIRTQLAMEAHEGRLWGDANLLRQVFDNLIDNAVQAMSEGGQLTVRVRAAHKDGTDGLAVDIIDTGEGMDTQVRSRALDPFFTTRPSGTGLGLAIVDRIVDAHGGHLEIDSRTGEGTTVTVFLPHGSPSDPPPVRTRASRPPGGTDVRGAAPEGPALPAPGIEEGTR